MAAIYRLSERDPRVWRLLSSVRLDSATAEQNSLQRAYLTAQLSGDRRAALKLIEAALRDGMKVPELHLTLVEPAQQEIGRLWQENRISVAQEHLATSISQLVVTMLYQHLPRGEANGRVALVACVEGEHHDMGGRMGADFLEMAGFSVRLLGSNVAIQKVVQALAETNADVLGLSATTSFCLPALVRTVEAVRQARPSLPILLGGQVTGFHPELAASLRLQGTGTNAQELAAECRKLFRC
jgi:methanogenic corrinoid protein MtbC1